MVDRQETMQAFRAASPIVVGYVALGIPAGILCHAAGMDLAQVALLAVFMYSGSGQYMIPNMFMAGASVLSVSATVSLVSSRQLLYGSALSRWFSDVPRHRLALFAATVTDESFGVNLARFQAGPWKPGQAQVVNSFSHLSWIVSCTVGAALGSALSVPTSVAGFAMTSIFLCLLLMQRLSPSRVAAIAGSVLGVVVCKLVGLSGVAVLLGALLGVAVGFVTHRLLVEHGHADGDGGEGDADAVE